MVKYTLWRRTESHGKGCPEDGSESWEDESKYYIVPESKDDEHGDSMADACGDQDYSYRVGFKQMATFYSERKLNDIKDLRLDELEKIGMGRCEGCDTILPIGRGENFTYNDTKKIWECNDCEYKSREEYILSLKLEDEFKITGYLNPNSKDELVIEVKHNGRKYRGCISELQEDTEYDGLGDNTLGIEDDDIKAFVKNVKDRKNCPECRKSDGFICQYHLDKQFENDSEAIRQAEQNAENKMFERGDF